MKFIERAPHFSPVDAKMITKKILDIPYMTGERHTLDIYYPSVSRETYPVIIDVYGGGLYFGAKSSYKLQNSLALTAAGYVVISPNYSLIWQAPFPTQIYELKAVIRWVRAHAQTYQFDPTKIILSGESSGAHLAVLTAATASVRTMMADFGPDLTVDDRVAAVIAAYGPYQFDTFSAQFKVLGLTPKFSETGTASSFEGQLFGKIAPSDVTHLVEKYNPANYLTATMPPMLLLAGTADQVVPILQSQNLAVAALQKMPQSHVAWQWLKGAHHGPQDFARTDIYDLKVQLLNKWLWH